MSRRYDPDEILDALVGRMRKTEVWFGRRLRR
jgi:hypothetical protein